ncbi:bifunctional phosphopantothenoylcysteine decarboxylase/phosphopantothenate--cysteine ligase CoaBC [Labrys sp. ZIDIC5]|uniref:bifunctional phosphopantothenoylcysteine decarboxylase/phosphopantothenate--cysteine ligase CoaBC n=1 Tax=Labrys sedimenti TaxID=3106036 RepID=UPI002ACAC404|nr:bifunctional phosphopantothenoylcysteine decarboxylase/phosphopantothenate--cysteine ligase CoaBC [Labrys sp. ZIDIC5]MDZ5450341.1 bifunctional phosphopantothenoylcysteine decarboxylase/phosphopantothenate--cysteine ligase CoaBC [Labrys sp. ZIDIC5]
MSTTLVGKRILLIIGGGIAAYKGLELIRRLRERGADVRAVLTKAGEAFVTPLSVSALTGDKVYTDLFSLTDEAEMGHIEMSRDADLLVVAPATADLLAKMAQGLANDLASTTLLATDKSVLVAPAMNVRMWLHPATQRNIAQLREDGVLFVGPNDGEMACGEYGPGRLAEPLEIVAAIEKALAGPTFIPLPGSVRADTRLLPALPLAGKHVLVTAGPTHEPIDPVRYIANRSSGKQGYAIAAAALAAGARVTLVSGPVALLPPPGVNLVPVETAREMLDAVSTALPADIAIFAAAVADWRVADAGAQKIKKGAEATPSFSLVENPDILATIAKDKANRPSLVVGFAAETEHVVEHAKAKLARKGCDLIVANDVSPESGVMGGDRNRVHLVSASGVETWPDMDKDAVARALVARFGELAGAPVA